jgi:hypothetical protein
MVSSVPVSPVDLHERLREDRPYPVIALDVNWTGETYLDIPSR